MLDDRVCLSCQVLPRDGTRTCPKCGRTVEPEKTGLAFIDIPRKIYAWLIQYFGPIGAGVVTGAVFLLFVVILIGSALIRSAPAP
jgi:hypothetical protein